MLIDVIMSFTASHQQFLCRRQGEVCFALYASMCKCIHTRARRFIPVTAETSALPNDSNVWGALMCCFHCPSPPVPRNSLKNTISLKHLLWALHNGWGRKDKKSTEGEEEFRPRDVWKHPKTCSTTKTRGWGQWGHCCITGVSATEKLWAVKCQSLLHPEPEGSTS